MKHIFKITSSLLLLSLITSCNSKTQEERHADTLSKATEETHSPAPEVTPAPEVQQNENTSSNSTEKHAIDQVYEDCMGIPENQTTVGMCDCASEAQQAWDKEMNEYYNGLMRGLKEDEKAKLKIAQQKWLVYRDAEFDFSGTAYYNMEGTMYRPMAVARQMGFVRERALELKQYYSVFLEKGE